MGEASWSAGVKQALKRASLSSPAGIATVVIVAVLAFGLGMLTEWLFSPAPPPSTSAEATYYCPMHPAFTTSNPNALCPICHMAVERLDSSGPAAGLTLSENARALMRLETAPVERRPVTATVSMLGEIDVDETRVKDITAWAAGRLERLFVDYTGMVVRQGDHMVELYSPDLITVQAELIETARAVASLTADDRELVRESAVGNAAAARERARQLGLTDAQIDRIIEARQTQERMTVYAPVSGIVVKKLATQGQYVQKGQPIYTVADLSQVWLRLDARESDVPLLRYGQRVTFTATAYGGQTFEGVVTFVAPVVDPRTRTVDVRVNAPNPGGRLMPGMFVRAYVKANVTSDGAVVPTDLSGTWICPMHYEVVSDAPGDCTICQMPLESAESVLGRPETAPAMAPMVIPESAVLWTGERAIVYVETPDPNDPFKPRQIALGPKVGTHYIVRSGLDVGERVVVRGTFMLDDERKLRNLPSMTNPPPGGFATAPPSAPAERQQDALPNSVARALADLVSTYLKIQGALAGDNADAAARAAAALDSSVPTSGLDQLTGDAADAWRTSHAAAGQAAQGIAQAEDIRGMRVAFQELTEHVAALARRFGDPTGRTLFVLRCPMAFDGAGAIWLQTDREVRNPYFGSQMFSCGRVLGHVAPAGEAPSDPHHHD